MPHDPPSSTDPGSRKVPEAPETPESSSGSLFHIERGGQEHLSTVGSWVLGDP